MSPRGFRRKGNRVERELVDLHHEHGIPAERGPLSGAAGGSFSGDLLVAGKLRGEVKARRNGSGFATLERWLGENDVLYPRRDRATPLVVVPFLVWAAILDAAGLANDREAR
jgi:Holliday junction resolvase